MKFRLIKFFELKTIPPSIWALGFVSLFMDTASESIHSILPIFMVATLHVSMTSVGIVEGIAEATALIVRIFSGILSDLFRRHKLLTMIGYGLAALSKPLFPLANSIGLVLGARFIDRVGKGIRGAPRDALIGEIAPIESRGACFGLRQSMDTIGAFLGPLLAMAGLALFADDIRTVLWLAVIPAILSFLLLWFCVKEPARPHTHHDNKSLRLVELTRSNAALWKIVIVAGIVGLARYSEAFLILKARETGVAVSYLPLVLIAMNLVYAGFAYPAGILSDKIGRKKILCVGIFVFIVANLILSVAHHWLLVFIGVALFGLHLACTQGLFAAMITDVTDAKLRGTAFGIFYMVTGIAMLIASIGAGLIWDSAGANYVFVLSAIIASIALVTAFVMKTKSASSKV